MLWLTSTLSTLSRLISKGRRLMNPVLWTTRMLVTSVAVVQRWNQAVAVQYKAASPAAAANAKQNNISASPVTTRHSTRNATVTIHAAIAGRKNIQCSLVEYSTLSPGCKISSIYRPIRLILKTFTTAIGSRQRSDWFSEQFTGSELIQPVSGSHSHTASV